MSLQIWLPLDGTLENKGCCNLDYSSTVSASYTDEGKIGKALQSGNLKMSASTAGSFLNNDAFSFCCWVYVNAEEGDKTNRATFYGNEEMVENNNRKFSIFQYPSCNDLHISWMNDATTGGIGPAWYGVFPSYQWTHVAVTYQNPIIKIYINGELLDTKTFTSTSNTFAYDTWLFKSAPNNSKYLNDYRVYNHCLSQAEVKEIAQGLVVHYKLDNDGFGKENLLPCGGTYTRNSPWTTSLSRTDGFNWVTNSAFEATPSTTYTISVECDGNLAPSHDTGGLNPEDKKWTLWLYICNTDTEKTWNNNAYDTPVNLNSNNNNYRKIGNTHVWTYTLSSTQKYISVRTNSYSDGETVLTLHWWNFKIEEGSEFTSWIPNTSNGLYKILGLDEKKIIDSSGYGRHGDVVGTAQFSTDTVRYTNSYVMDGLVANRIEYNKTTFNYTDNFSWAMWVRANHTGDAAQYVFTSGRADAGGYGFGLQNSNDTSLSLRFGNKSYYFEIVKNEWTHVAFTKSGTSIKLYKNGELYSSYTFDGSLPTYSDGKGLGLGCFHYTGNIYPAYGNISDFRIYCTALSADAIRNLYKTQLKIDNYRKFHSFEIVEENSTKIKNNGDLICTKFFEDGHEIFYHGGFSFKPAANTRNSTHNVLVVDFGELANLGTSIPINIQCDISWENFAFISDPENSTSLNFQGDSKKKEDDSWEWVSNYVTNGYSLKSLVQASSNGTHHMNVMQTVPVSWFETHYACRFGMRCDYSDGNGTIWVRNIRVTIASNCAKIINKYILANEFIEK